MKNIQVLFRNCRIRIFPVLFLSFLALNVIANIAQEDEPIQTRMSLSLIQGSDETITLFAKLRYREEGQYYNIPDKEIIFHYILEDDEIEIGRAITNEDGESYFSMKDPNQLRPYDENIFSITAKFEGDTQFSDSDTDVEFKKAKISVRAEVIDSVYKLFVSTFELDENETPIGEQDLKVLVPRMFSNLTIFNDYTDEDGQIEVTFPNDLPAGQNGKLEIIVRIPDTDDYGTLESRISTEWGVPLNTQNTLASRELWSPDAPMWMLITFIILMGLVWGHFGIILYKLYLVRKEGSIIDSPL